MFVSQLYRAFGRADSASVLEAEFLESIRKGGFRATDSLARVLGVVGIVPATHTKKGWLAALQGFNAPSSGSDWARVALPVLVSALSSFINGDEAPMMGADAAIEAALALAKASRADAKKARDVEKAAKGSGKGLASVPEVAVAAVPAPEVAVAAVPVPAAAPAAAAVVADAPPSVDDALRIVELAALSGALTQAQCDAIERIAGLIFEITAG